MKPKAPPKAMAAPATKPMASSPIKRNVRKIMLVDDHPVMRQGVAELINHESDLTVCGQFEDSATAFDAIPSLLPDLAMVDLSLKSSSGLELVKNIKAAYPKVLVLVFSMHDEALYAERVLRAGAAGYIMKQEATEKVLAALRRVLGGGIYLSERMSSKFMHQLVGGKQVVGGSPVERLSDRELEVFGLIGQGRGTRQIAEQLHLSVKTIESHRAHIKEKLNLKNATELVHRAIEMRGEQ
ncbi:MAG TPA: response regulator transcription factor [Candidatus Saccharimonadales bacterium]|nr:response regulator transcription factor [Candidatus Saccharimonadales bacterium]